MTTTMWLTLVASVGMATLVVPVVRARHELAAPLAALIADMLVWNLAWLAFQISGDPRWHYLTQCASALVMVLGLDFVLTFVGRRRRLSALRYAAFAYHGLLTLWSASRFITPALFDEVWTRLLVGGGAATTVVIGWLLVMHHAVHRERSERAHTRLLMIGLALWLVLAATDLVHSRVPSIPQMSALGMLLSVAVMAIVMDRVRPHGRARWWTLYTLALFVVTASGHVLVFKTLPADEAMLVARGLLFAGVLVVAGREVVVMISRRRQRVAELALLGRVTAQMAHDLQNPLAAIKGAAQIIEEDRRRGMSAAREEKMLSLITQQVERLSAIVDDYRRVGRIEPRAEPVSLSEVVRRIARPARCDFEVDVFGAPPILADPELVTRALENLVRNAAEAMPDGGRVSLCAETLGDGASQWVEITVSDDGPGMDARTSERAFDDFFTTKAQGSGLGLAFVRRVAEVHNGVARIQSRVGRGTQVTLRLPCAPGPSEILARESARCRAPLSVVSSQRGTHVST